MNVQSLRQYPLAYVGSNMYLFVENQTALVIDPNISQEALQYLNACDVSTVTILLTHEHYDHISGISWMRKHFSCCVVAHSETNISLQKGSYNRPIVLMATLMGKIPRGDLRQILSEFPQGFHDRADICFRTVYSFRWNGHTISCVPTPGHSCGSCCIELDCNMVVTGDTLLEEGKSVTSFYGSDLSDFENITLPYLKGIPDGTLILPGHGSIFVKDAMSVSI